MENTIICTLCFAEKPIEEFHFKDSKKGIRRKECGPCRNEIKRENRNKPKVVRAPKTTKMCTICKVDKPREDFPKNGKNLRGECKQCAKAKRAASKPPPDPKEEKTSSTCITCKIEKPLSEFYIRKDNGSIRGQCKECTRAKKKQWNVDNKARKYEYDKNYREQPLHREANKQYQKNYHAINIENNIEYRIKRSLRSRIKDTIPLEFRPKESIKLLGCSVGHFRKWIEYQFADDMSWNNHGKKWHLDHVKPCDIFDLTDPEQQKECFFWKNVRPLGVSENSKKHNNFSQELIDQINALAEQFQNTLNQVENPDNNA